MSLPALKLQTTPKVPKRAEDRLEQALRPEFRTPVFHAPHGNPIFWNACQAARGTCRGVGRIDTDLCYRHTKEAWHFLGVGVGERKLTRQQIHRFLAEAEQRAYEAPDKERPVYDMSGLPELLRLQISLFLQNAHDRNTTTVSAMHFKRIIGHLRAHGIRDIFQTATMTAEEFVRQQPSVDEIDLGPYDALNGKVLRDDRRFIRDIIRQAAPVMHPMPVEERDRWRRADFGIEKRSGEAGFNISFGQRVPWFKAACKKYAAYEIKVRGMQFISLASRIRELNSFDQFLLTLDEPPSSMAELTRAHIEDYMLWLRQNASQRYADKVGHLRIFLETWRQLDWQPRLQPGTTVRRMEVIKSKQEPTPQPLDPYVLAQITSPGLLSLMDPTWADLLIIGRYHGLRPSSLCSLPFDCLRFSDQGEDLPVLHYNNVKLSRRAAQPILTQMVVDAVRRQQRRVRERFPSGCQWLFPKPTGNTDGKLHRSVSSLIGIAQEISERGLLKNRDGSPASINWSNFRDTRACELLNDGVQPSMVAAWLDHANTSSLEHYGRYRTETLRQAIDNTPQITRQGEDLRSQQAADADLTIEAMRQAAKLATNTVSGGFCTIPVRDTCAHLNACFTCDSFATTPAHLPELLAGLEKSDLLVMAHEARGQQRMAEKERQEGDKRRRIVQVLDGWLQEHPEDGTPIEDWLLTHRQQLNRALSGATLIPEDSSDETE